MSDSEAAFHVDLTNCDAEPIHVPGAIQPHGVLFALQEPELTVRQVSENVAARLGVRPEDLLSQPIARVLDDPSTETVRAAFAENRWEDLNPLRITVAGRRFDGIAHRHANVAILELEPATERSGAANGHHPLRPALGRAQVAESLDELCQYVVEEIRRLTGFERVLLYRFDEDGHGSVVAETKDDGLEPYLGLHYPASDIPAPARALYRKNWLRTIPDARYVPARLVPSLRPDTKAPLDLSFAVLRSVSPIHLEYLANLGVRASMSVSLLVRGHLWGLVSCANHSGPRSIPYELRSACEILGRLASLQIGALEEREASGLRASRRGTQDSLASAMRGTGGDVDVLESLLRHPSELLGLVGAEGAAVVEESNVLSIGRTPPHAAVASLASWLEERGETAPFATASLPILFPAAIDEKDVASGLLAFALPGKPARRLLWFRPELQRTVNWGGDPRKPASADPSLRLHPRRSFELWREEVRLRSAPWRPSDLEAAEELRRNAVEIDLARQVQREQAAVQARDDLVAVVSHDLKNPLGVLQMQATLLLRATANGDEEPSRRLRASAERIQRSVDRMNALIYDLLDLAKIEAGRLAVEPSPADVGELVEESLLILRPLAEAKRLTVREEISPRLRVLVDRERFFQVLSNLFGNAIKFTPEAGGAILVRAEARASWVRFEVSDSGPGIAPDQLIHVFDRYWQAPRRSAAGSGLGLFICKGIVEAHGGRIWAESTPGAGARFFFELPAG